MNADLLIVDDSVAIRKILQRALRQAQLPIGKVYEAGDGREALDVLRNHAVRLVMTDINMPNMNGLELLAEIRGSENLKELPVILITTESGHGTVEEAVQMGASAYIRKPFTPDQIQVKLQRYFA